MTEIKQCRALVLLGILLVGGESVRGAAITVPIDLNPGDDYRIAFVTQGGTPASNSDVAFYNNFVSAQAALSGDMNALGTNWSAIVSTPTQDARSNTGTGTDGAGIPIYNSGGERIANSYADLWNGTLLGDLSSTLTGGIRYDQFGIDGPGVGTSFGGDLVWTGTSEFGAQSGGGLGSGGVTTVGFRIQNSFQWIRGQGITISTPNLRVYGISDVLTVSNAAAIPEPSSALLLSVLGAGLGVLRRRRRSAVSVSL